MAQQTLYKLMVLYMLRQIDFSMTLAQISDFVLGKEYTDAFTLQSTMASLTEGDLVNAQTLGNITYYAITEEGEHTIDLLEDRIAPALRKDIVDFLKTNRHRMRNEVSVLSDYSRRADGEYEVRCVIREKGEDLLDLRLALTDEEQARSVSLNWSKDSQEIYSYLIRTLLRE